MKLICTFFLCLLYKFSCAQLVIINGNSNTSNSTLIGQNYYHVSESIYLNAEIGNSNFLSNSTAINVVSFDFSQIGTPSIINNFKIWMKNISSTVSAFSNGTYTTTGYTLVFNGSFNAGMVGWNEIKLSTPFVRTAGSNLQILVERLDGVLHTANIGFTNGFIASTANGNANSFSAFSSRRYNGANSPISTTSLSVTAFRPTILLSHKSNYDIAVREIIHPTISCYTSFKDIQVRVANLGTDTIFQNQASITLKTGGANRNDLTLNNPNILLPGDSGLITFYNVNLSNAGNNFDTCIVFKSGDIINSNDTIFSNTITSSSISTFPIVEDVESIPVAISFSEIVQGNRQLWSIQNGNYTNADQTIPLTPRALGNNYFLFDAYSGSSSVGTISRLYSKCISLPRLTPTVTSRNISFSFWMSHDNINFTANDSLYVVVSTNQGLTWNRLLGLQRSDELLTGPTWLKDSVDLSIYAGQTIQLGFEGISYYGNAFGLDDISLTVDPNCNNPVIVFAGNNASICSNKTFTLSAGNPSIGGSATSAIWKTSGTGTFLNGNNFGTALSYQPSATDSILGNVNISLVSNGLSNVTCENDSASFNLVINPIRVIPQYASSCLSYVWQGQTFTSSGIYTWTGTNSKGCDSSIRLYLTINTPTSSTTNIAECYGYNWNGVSYSNSGSYTFHTINSKGCDSTAYLNLTINAPTSSIINITRCYAYNWNGTTYPNSGTYSFLTTNSKGCDSTAFLNLTINASTTSSTNFTRCNAYNWNGITYSNSGTYSFLTTNAKGCDSTAYLFLTINTPTTSTTNIAQCYGYNWNGVWYSNSGTYSFNTTNAKGCDSTAVLNLTINNASTKNINVTHCGNYFWNGITYTTSGTYSYTTNNSLGCDSFSVLTLQINNCINELNVKVFLEGHYQGENLMTPFLFNIGLNDSSNACDSIEICLWSVNQLNNESASFRDKAILKTNGMAHFLLPSDLTGDYYIALKHRNSIEIWSAQPVSFPTFNLHDFSLSNNTFTDGFNSSQKLMPDGNYAMYCGDVNQDGTIDIFDQQNLENAVLFFDFGYLLNDCNADGVEDIFDMQIIENNTSLYLYYARPY